MTWCGSRHQRLCQLSLGTCLAVVAGAGMQTDVKSASRQQAGAGGGWMLSNNAKQGSSGRGSSGVRSQSLSIEDPDLMRRPLASRVMKLCASCGHHNIVVGYVNRHSSSATLSGGIFSQVLSGVFSKR